MLTKKLEEYMDNLISRYSQLMTIKNEIIDAYLIIEECYKNNAKLLIAGNGGSAADAEHIVGELMKRFKIARPVNSEFAEKLKKIDREKGKVLAGKLEEALVAIPLTTHEALITAYMNDIDASCVFAQQLFGYGCNRDVFFAISTSGNSSNIINAAIVAKAKEMKTIALTGSDGGLLSSIADVTVRVPETETYMIQELHLPIYHCWCLMLEEKFFGNDRFLK